MANTAALTKSTINSLGWLLVTDGAGTVSTVLNQATVAGIIGLSVAASVQAVQLRQLLTQGYATSALVRAAFEGVGATFSSSLIYCDWAARLVAGTAPTTMPKMVSSASGGFGVMTITNEDVAATYLITCQLHGIDG